MHSLLAMASLASALFLPAAALAVTSNVQLVLPDGRNLNAPVAVTLDQPFSFTQGASGAVQGTVNPRYTADLGLGWFEMAAGVSMTTQCGSACSAQVVNLGTFIITQQIKLVSPDKRPIEVSASWTTLASIDMPVDAWVNAQFKLGLLSGAYAPQPSRNTWLECWANTDSAATKARCPNPLSNRIPLDTADTRSLTVSVSSGSTLQLEVFGALQASVPVPSGTSSFTGTMLLDPLLRVSVPFGTIVEAGSLPVTVVPEPASAALLLAGLALLVAECRRHRKAATAQPRTLQS